MNDHRNIVLVTMDSLRADHCGFMGYDRDTTPALDEMADNGVVFENAIAPGPSTPESMPAVFTGRYPCMDRHGDLAADRRLIGDHLARSRTIPERLEERGYATAGFSSNPFTSRGFGFDAGFDHYEDFLTGDDFGSRLRSRAVSRWLDGRFVAGLRFGLNMLGVGDIALSWESYYEDLLAWVSRAPEPYFLWVFLLEPHWPYRPPRRHRNESLPEMYRLNWRSGSFSNTPTPADADGLRRLYDGAVRHADEFVGRLRHDLAGTDPIIAVHADHGEAFGEHGTYGHKPQLYEENIHVPLVVGNAGNHGQIASPMSLRALPGLLDAIATGTDDWSAHTDVWTTARSDIGGSVAVRGRDWKYVHEPDGAAVFDLAADPTEREDLTETRPALVETGEHLAARHASARHEERQIARAAATVARETVTVGGIQ